MAKGGQPFKPAQGWALKADLQSVGVSIGPHIAWISARSLDRYCYSHEVYVWWRQVETRLSTGWAAC